MLVIVTKAKKSDMVPVVNATTAGTGFTDFRVETSSTLPMPEEGNVYLICGSALVKELGEVGVVAKNRTIASTSGQPHPYGDAVVFTTYDPRIIHTDMGMYTKILWDIRLAIRYMATGSTAPQLGNYVYVDNFDYILHAINTSYDDSKVRVPITCDLETLGLDEYSEDAYIVSIAFTVHSGTSMVMHFSGRGELGYKDTSNPNWQCINEILNTPKAALRGANFKYDRRWIRHHWGMSNDNYTMDTTLVGSLLNENRSNSLNTHAKIASSIGGYDDEFNKKIDKSRMDLVDKGTLLPYAGGDTDACYQVSEVFKEELLKQPHLARFYVKILHPSVTAFEDMEREGVLLDTDYYYGEGGLRDEILAEIDSIEQEAFGLMSKRLKIKHKGALLLTRADLIKDFMFTPLGLDLTPLMYTAKAKSNTAKYASVASKHLLMFADNPKAKAFIDCIKRFTSAKKTLGTYVDGFGSFLRRDGRFHPSYILFKGDYGGGTEGGTNTGRTACKDPALQTIPKHTVWAAKLRRGYTAPEGFKIVNWDYSQGELRIAACIADEPGMISAYRSGIDLHLKTGSRLIGIQLEEASHIKKGGSLSDISLSDEFVRLILLALGSKDFSCVAEEDALSAAFGIVKVARQNGKAGNFGLLYGMGAKGYKIYARDSYGVVLTDSEAEAARDDFFSLYQGLVTWHTKYKAIAKRSGAIISPLGRVRHLPLVNSSDQEAVATALRQSINAPVQSTLSDLGQYSLVKFKEQFGTPDGCRMFLFTHDSLTAYVREEELDFWVPQVANIMETLPLKEEFGWEPQIPFLVDAEVGINMAELEEVARCW
jgi:DNA polymerase I-like protein with 3'-5' exonuclease and polymerase domains